jgi:hypothetical protein
MAKTAWQTHLMKTFKKLKSKNKDAKLSDAMKVAGKTYKKKPSKGGALKLPKMPTMGGKRKTRKSMGKKKTRKTKSMKGGQLSFSEYDSNPSLGEEVDNTENFEEDMEGGEDLMDMEEMEGGIEEPFRRRMSAKEREKKRRERNRRQERKRLRTLPKCNKDWSDYYWYKRQGYGKTKPRGGVEDCFDRNRL